MAGTHNRRTMISALAFVAIFTSPMMIALSQTDDEAACEPVMQELTPCLSFIKGSDSEFGGPKPSPECCNGVKKLISDTKTKADKVATCECLKKALGMIGTYDPSRIPLITKNCGIAIQIPPIDNSTDCSK